MPFSCLCQISGDLVLSLSHEGNSRFVGLFKCLALACDHGCHPILAGSAYRLCQVLCEENGNDNVVHWYPLGATKHRVFFLLQGNFKSTRPDYETRCLVVRRLIYLQDAPFDARFIPEYR